MPMPPTKRAGEDRAMSEHVDYPLCQCGQQATCYGLYEGIEGYYGCDDCCGHSCENGECVPVGVHLLQENAALRERLRLADELAKAMDEMIPRFIELRRYREQRGGTEWAIDFPVAEKQSKEKLAAYRSVGQKG